MKKLEIPGRFLGKAEQKMIFGGSQDGCLKVGEPCNDDVQCCSNNCITDSGSSTGCKCGTSTGIEDDIEP